MLKITDNIKLGKLVGSSGNTGSGGSGGGSSNYNDLTNKPSINSISLNGNKTSADLGVLDLNTTELQTMKGGLIVDSGLAIAKNNIPVGAIAVYDDFQGYDQALIFGSGGDLGVPVFLGGENTFFQSNPKIMSSTPLTELPDNALLTKAQVIEATNGSIGGSSNYNDLENKPSINGVELSGNKTSADLGVLDLNTTNPQFIKSALFIEKGLAITENNNPMAFLGYENGAISLGSLDGANDIRLFSKNTVIVYTPIIETPTALADLPDNALLTKAQVQEMINNALNNS